MMNWVLRAPVFAPKVFDRLFRRSCSMLSIKFPYMLTSKLHCIFCLCKVIFRISNESVRWMFFIQLAPIEYLNSGNRIDSACIVEKLHWQIQNFPLYFLKRCLIYIHHVWFICTIVLTICTKMLIQELPFWQRALSKWLHIHDSTKPHVEKV